MQIVERMDNGQSRKVVRTQVTQPSHAKLDQGRTEVGPCEQGAHQQNRIAVNNSGWLRRRLIAPTVDGAGIPTRSKGQNNEDVHRRHLVVIEMGKAAQESFVK